MWKLSNDTGNTREYTNATTGSRCTMTMLKQDRDGNKWYGFDNLMEVPYLRTFMAQKVTSLFALGLSKDDLAAHVDGLKSILRSADPDKYEKAYAMVLDFESKVNAATDAIKQISSLVCVYHTMNDEVIDSWDNALQVKKMSILAADLELHSFFLNNQMRLTENYMSHCALLSQIASPRLNGQQDHSLQNSSV